MTSSFTTLCSSTTSPTSHTYALTLHDALPISPCRQHRGRNRQHFYSVPMRSTSILSQCAALLFCPNAQHFYSVPMYATHHILKPNALTAVTRQDTMPSSA